MPNVTEIIFFQDGTVKIRKDNDSSAQTTGDFSLEISPLLEAIWSLEPYQQWIQNQGVFSGFSLAEIGLLQNAAIQVREIRNNKNYRFAFSYPNDPIMYDTEIVRPDLLPFFQAIWGEPEYENWVDYELPSGDTPPPV
jgi:hypothetical protein